MKSSPIRIVLLLTFSLGLLAACRPAAAGLHHPTGVAVGADGSLYVMDHTNLWHSQVVHISADGKAFDTFTPPDPRPEMVYAGWDMAVGPTGDVYYCNLITNDERTLHDGVMGFTQDGKPLPEIGAADYDPHSSTVPAVPYNLDVDSRSWIYVTDVNYNQLRVFDPQGQLLAKFNAENTPNFSYRGIGDVAVDEQRGLLYLTDFFAGRLDQYRLDAGPGRDIRLTRQFSIGVFGHDPGQFSFPQYLALDEDSGLVYVGDMGNRRIQAFDPQGELIAGFAPPVDDWQVLGLAVSARGASPTGGRVLYAADALNRVIWVFSLDGQTLDKLEVH